VQTVKQRTSKLCCYNVVLDEFRREIFSTTGALNVRLFQLLFVFPLDIGSVGTTYALNSVFLYVESAKVHSNLIRFV
jgi:hypothetical protein